MRFKLLVFYLHLLLFLLFYPFFCRKIPYKFVLFIKQPMNLMNVHSFLEKLCTTCHRISGLILLVITKISPSCLPKTPVNMCLRFSTVYNSRILEYIYQFRSLGGFSHKAQCSLYVI